MKWLQNVIVGLLFFGALGLVGYFTIISESGPFATQGNQVVLFFDNADGVKIGSRVTVLGVPAGRVIAINLVSVNADGEPLDDSSAEQVQSRIGQRVAITAELQRSDPVVFYENYSIEVKNESLLSGRIVAINPGSALPGADGKAPAVIPVLAVSSGTLSERGQTALQYHLEQRSTAGYRDLQGRVTGDPIAALSEMIAENRDDVRKTINNIASITEKINTGKGTLGQLINNDELHKNANTLVTDAQVVVKEVRETLEDTREQAPVTSMIRAALTAF